jgi:hypothetical protein
MLDTVKKKKKQICGVNTDTDTLRRDQKKTWEVKNSMNINDVWWPHPYTVHGKERVNELEGLSETSQT